MRGRRYIGRQEGSQGARSRVLAAAAEVVAWGNLFCQWGAQAAASTRQSASLDEPEKILTEINNSYTLEPGEVLNSTVADIQDKLKDLVTELGELAHQQRDPDEDRES